MWLSKITVFNWYILTCQLAQLLKVSQPDSCLRAFMTLAAGDRPHDVASDSVTSPGGVVLSFISTTLT